MCRSQTSSVRSHLDAAADETEYDVISMGKSIDGVKRSEVFTAPVAMATGPSKNQSSFPVLAGWSVGREETRRPRTAIWRCAKIGEVWKQDKLRRLITFFG